MNPAALADLVRTAAVDVLTRRDLDRSALPATVTIERPRDPAHGDYATNVALQVANLVGVAPRELAGWLATELAGRDGVAAAGVAGPGFVNLRIDAAARGEIVRQVLAAGERYGTGDRFAGRTVTVDLTVNPTGPLHLGVTRQAAVGDTLGRVLAAQGAEVTRVCHVDADGAHIDQFVHSLIASARGAPPPEDGYAGTYLSDAAAEVLRREPSALSLPADECAEIFRRVGVGLMLDEIKQSLTEFRADFDEFCYEPHDTGGQPVRLIRDGTPVLMSNRAGTVVVLADLVDAVGVDAARYALIRSALDVPLDIDVGVWSRQTDDNPLFSVRYAHTRLAAVAVNADDLGVDTAEEPDLALLTDQLDGALIHTLGDFPITVEQAGEAREPHRVARYLEELADTYHRFASACRVLPQGDELPTPLTTARLALCAAARQVLANGLRLLGVTAPERI